jgi:hypothetical protein
VLAVLPPARHNQQRMARRSTANSQTAGMILTGIAIVAFIWGLERWRTSAAHHAGHSARARVLTLSRCLLGRDGPTLMRSPDAARRRLRALALQTSDEASVTWFDRCVPLARSLAMHASEVDNTRALTAAETRVAERTRYLAEAISRVGLVWRIRTGDPETDMDLVAERLAQVASEVQLAAPDDRSDAEPGPIGPDPAAEVTDTLIPTVGLEPAPLGTPTRFLVGAPLPSITEVIREGDGYRLAPIANEPAYAWRLSASGVVRIDVLIDRSDDGLAPLRTFRLDAEPVEARVTPVNDALTGIHVSLDAASAGTALWVAEWTPWTGTALARFVPGRDATATTLVPASREAAARARDPELGRVTTDDEHVAIAPYQRAALVAYTAAVGDGTSTVRLATTLADSPRAEVVPVGERVIQGHAPSLEFCPRSHGDLALVIAGAHEWRVLRIDVVGATDLARVESRPGFTFDERVIVRCDANGLVAYARDHVRGSPVLVCGSQAETCVRSDAPPTPVLSTMPLYVTHTSNGRALAHAEWPMAFARAGGTLVAARAVGPVVSVARKTVDAARWADDRVVFDAAARMHGYSVEGLDLYVQGDTLALAVATSDGLHILRSDDAGATWH